jgi:hypothetical protein
MKKANTGRIVGIVILILLAGLIIAEARTRFIHRWINDVVYDNRVPILRCEELPTLPEVEQTLAAHQDMIAQIEAISSGISVYTNSVSSCPEKGLLVIEYASHAEREQIEALIGETFFGIPWEGHNV